MCQGVAMQVIASMPLQARMVGKAVLPGLPVLTDCPLPRLSHSANDPRTGTDTPRRWTRLPMQISIVSRGRPRGGAEASHKAIGSVCVQGCCFLLLSSSSTVYWISLCIGTLPPHPPTPPRKPSFPAVTLPLLAPTRTLPWPHFAVLPRSLALSSLVVHPPAPPAPLRPASPEKMVD